MEQTWDEAKFLKNLCKDRCNNPNFGNIRFNGPWPSDDLVILTCNRECETIYGSLLNEVPRGGVLAEIGEKDVTNAIGVVKKAIGDTEEATSGRRGKGVAGASLRIELLRKLHGESRN